MKRMKRFSNALAVIIMSAVILALSACGQPGPASYQTSTDPATTVPVATDAAPTTATEPTTVAPTAAADAAQAQESDLQYIKDKGELTVGITLFEPMNYYEGDELTGFDTRFARAVCEKLGVTPNFTEINWDTKEIELAAKSIDCIWNGMTITPERVAEMSISLPYVKNAQIVVVRADSGITSTADLIGKSVAAEIGSAGELQITGSEDAAPEENLAKANFVGMTFQVDCLLEVKAGTSDAAVLDWTLAKTMVGEGTDYADLIMLENTMMGEEEYGIAFRRDSDVTAAVNEVIKELVSDGTLPALAAEYNLSLSPALTD